MKARRFLLAWALAIAGAAAHAHAFLDHADPRVGSTVPVAPAELRLWFSQDVEPAFTTIEVLDASGRRVDGGHVEADPNDRTMLRSALQKRPPGAYTVKWRSVSVDTHPSQGRFTFRVGQ